MRALRSVAVLFVFIFLAILLLSYNSISRSSFSTKSSVSEFPFHASLASPVACHDPYRAPGYFHIDHNNVRLSQWIPFTDDTGALDVPVPESAHYPTDTIPVFTADPPPQEFIAAGPHNWLIETTNYKNLLEAIERAKGDGSDHKPLKLTDVQQRLIGRMNWLHNRRVLALGDSVDRIMIEEFCNVLGHTAKRTEGKYGGQHTTYRCTIPVLNFTIYHWQVASMYPMRPPWFWLDHIKELAFEDRFKSIYEPVRAEVIGMNGKTPDLILFQSGLWDERAFRESTRNMPHPGDENLSPEQLAEAQKQRAETGLGRAGRQLSWDELMFFKARMNKFMDYIRDYFGGDPNLPMMYRGLTTRRQSTNSDLATINMDRLSRALAARKGIEIFEWARLTLAFSNEYSDYLHIGKGPLNILWANMMFYYLFRASGGAEFNGTFFSMPDPVAQYVIEGQGAIGAPEIVVPSSPDTEVNSHWASCHRYNVHWGGR
ncbi:hypothetical protein BZA70DRAFT_89840 [Myxozyma melibiosi]|uniref:Alternative oxidase n=1 Tax=Myxozyma melibiosi TaxID=54550 RepID=A0ABR1F1S0_9ASCO